jgi:hypothetical protein
VDRLNRNAFQPELGSSLKRFIVLDRENYRVYVLTDFIGGRAGSCVPFSGISG